MSEEKKSNLPDDIQKLPKDTQLKIMLRSLATQKSVQMAETEKAKDSGSKAVKTKWDNIWEYIIIRIGGIGLMLFAVFLCWVMTIIPYIYSIFIVGLIIGFFAGCLVMVNRK